MGVYHVCSNKSPGVKTGPALVAYIQVSDLRAIMALLFNLCFWGFFLVNDYILMITSEGDERNLRDLIICCILLNKLIY
jgi:hypothetical protein